MMRTYSASGVATGHITAGSENGCWNRNLEMTHAFIYIHGHFYQPSPEKPWRIYLKSVRPGTR